MYIDNTPSTSKWMFAEVISLILGIAFLIYAYISTENFKVSIIVSIVCILAFVLMMWINPSYVYFNVDEKFIDIRTMSAFPLMRKPKQYRFPKQGLDSYEFSTATMGFQKFVTLTVKGLDPKTKKPLTITTDPINISALSKKTIADFENTLKKYAKNK